MTDNRRQSRDDVLASFAVEVEPGRGTLERYLRLFPDYAEDLIDLSFQLGMPPENNQSLDAADHSRIQQAWLRHVETSPAKDVLAALTIDQLRQCALVLRIPRQVLTAFRERAVLPSSVPQKFMQRFAEAIDTTVDQLAAALSSPPAPALARSFKADGRPTPTVQVTLEQLLIDAGVPEETRADLLSEE